MRAAGGNTRFQYYSTDKDYFSRAVIQHSLGKPSEVLYNNRSYKCCILNSNIIYKHFYAILLRIWGLNILNGGK